MTRLFAGAALPLAAALLVIAPAARADDDPKKPARPGTPASTSRTQRDYVARPHGVLPGQTDSLPRPQGQHLLDVVERNGL